jgi:hypothetical protein
MRVSYAVLIALTAGLLAPAAAPAQGQAPAPAAPAKRAGPQRGVAELGHLKPTTKADAKSVVTTFQVKNLSQGAIVGLTISEFWFDKANNPVQGTGDRQRLRTPLQPGDTATVVLTSSRVPGMQRNVYQFAHANGEIKPRLLPKF